MEILCQSGNKEWENSRFLLNPNPYLYIPMNKRVSISFFLLLAFTLLQAHNYIPHTHKENNSTVHSHSHDKGENHDHEDKQQHETPFTDLTHNSDFGKAISKPFEKQVITKCGLSEMVFYPFVVKTFLYSSSKPHPPDLTSSIHFIFISHSVPLRAPPVSSILS